jgi:hypothetical protein
MVARQRVEFTDVELAAPVEKATAGPVEKDAVGPCAREARGGRYARWRGRKTGCCALARRRCRPAERRRDGEGSAMEREAWWRASSLRRCSGLERRRRELLRCYDEVNFFLLF